WIPVDSARPRRSAHMDVRPMSGVAEPPHQGGERGAWALLEPASEILGRRAFLRLRRAQRRGGEELPVAAVEAAGRAEAAEPPPLGRAYALRDRLVPVQPEPADDLRQGALRVPQH